MNHTRLGAACVALSLACGAAAIPGVASAAPAYTVRVVTGPPGRHPNAAAINDAGVLVGSTHGKKRHEPVQGWIGDAERHRAFVWIPGGRTQPLGLNAAGDVVGYAEDGQGNTWPVLRRHGQDIELIPGTTYGQAVGVNASGTVAGFADTGFTWQDGQITWLTGFDYPTAINDAGVVVGEAYHPFSVQGAARWIDGHLEFLPDLPAGGSSSSAFAVNRRGDIVGYCITPDHVERACLWHDGTVDDIGMLPGDFDAWALGINDAGIIVGTSDTSVGHGLVQEHAFVKRPGEPMRDLNRLVDLPGVVLSYALAINTSGQILVNGRQGDDDRFYVLDPVEGQ